MSVQEDRTPPAIEPAIKAVAMPADTNPRGDIFGGWLLSQMDIAGGIVAGETAQGRIATVAIDAMTFRQPVLVGDVISVYGQVERIGRTSIRVRVEAWARRYLTARDDLVTEGVFTYVAIDEGRKPRAIGE